MLYFYERGDTQVVLDDSCSEFPKNHVDLLERSRGIIDVDLYQFFVPSIPGIKSLPFQQLGTFSITRLLLFDNA
jgi:hypothetical protein